MLVMKFLGDFVDQLYKSICRCLVVILWEMWVWQEEQYFLERVILIAIEIRDGSLVWRHRNVVVHWAMDPLDVEEVPPDHTQFGLVLVLCKLTMAPNHLQLSALLVLVSVSDKPPIVFRFHNKVCGVC